MISKNFPYTREKIILENFVFYEIFFFRLQKNLIANKKNIKLNMINFNKPYSRI